jgi:hypothetical protein
MKELDMAAAFTPHRRGRQDAGQALVLMVGVMLVSIAILATIIDGGKGRGDRPCATARRRQHARRWLGRRGRGEDHPIRRHERHHHPGRLLHGHLRHPAEEQRHGRPVR